MRVKSTIVGELSTIIGIVHFGLEEEIPSQDAIIANFALCLSACVSLLSPLVQLQPRGMPSGSQKIMDTVQSNIGKLLQRFLFMARVRDKNEESDLLFIALIVDGISFVYESKCSCSCSDKSSPFL